MSERPNSDTEPAAAEAEVSRFSLWFLRGVLVVATAVVLAFAVQAIVSLLDDDGLADLPATTPTTDLGIDEATDSVEPGASDTPLTSRPSSTHSSTKRLRSSKRLAGVTSSNARMSNWSTSTR